jgi:transposase
MLHIRTTKTGSSSTAVQVVKYFHGKTIIIKHIGSASRKDELALLKHQAEAFVEKYTGQPSLFSLPNTQNENKIIQSRYARSAGFKYTLLRQLFTHLFHTFAFDELRVPLLNDLVMARIVNPSSKLQAITFLKEMFDISYSETDVYRELPTFSDLKEEVEKKIITFAMKHLNFNFTVVFYDVTTLYFETFKEDKENFKKPGFSKDNKFNQPQIVIGLIVNQDGFPVSYDIYAGNTFEGHTLIPSLTAFKKKHNVKNLTVIADAAMISIENVEALLQNNINYIVGARVSNLPERLIQEISSQLNMVDKANYRLTTKRGILICDFSKKRYWKNSYEMEGQLAKARKYEGKVDALPRKIKFLKSLNKTKTIINEALLEKTKLLLGIKGYYTNLEKEKNETIIQQYHNLWHVEKSFRMAKSDLQTRPIYHFKNKAIHSHILICFMALAVGTYMELSAKKSLQKILKITKEAVEMKIKDKITGDIITIQPELSTELQELLKKLNFTY